MDALYYLVDHPAQCLLIAISIAIVVYAVGKFLPDPLKFVTELTKILVHEFTGKEKIPAERIDMLILIILFLLTLVSLVLERAPSIVKQILGRDLESPDESNHYITFTCLIFLFVCALTSPVCIYLIRREQRIRHQIKSVLDENEDYF